MKMNLFDISLCTCFLPRKIQGYFNSIHQEYDELLSWKFVTRCFFVILLLLGRVLNTKHAGLTVWLKRNDRLRRKVFKNVHYYTHSCREVLRSSSGSQINLYTWLKKDRVYFVEKDTQVRSHNGHLLGRKKSVVMTSVCLCNDQFVHSKHLLQALTTGDVFLENCILRVSH